MVFFAGFGRWWSGFYSPGADCQEDGLNVQLVTIYRRAGAKTKTLNCCGRPSLSHCPYFFFFPLPGFYFWYTFEVCSTCESVLWVQCFVDMSVKLSVHALNELGSIEQPSPSLFVQVAVISASLWIVLRLITSFSSGLIPHSLAPKASCNPLSLPPCCPTPATTPFG